MRLQPTRLRRSTLAVPGSSTSMIEKAAALTVDQVLLDLEDAVAPNAKVAARGAVIRGLNNLQWTTRTLSLRINDVSTPWCHDDIIEVVTHAGKHLDTIILTKAKSVGDVRFVHLLLDQLERKLSLTKRIGIECLVEDVEGLMCVEEIAACSDRIETLVFGMGDYAASQQMPVAAVGSSEGFAGDLWHYPRFKLTIAARAYGIDPIDGPVADFNDAALLQLEAQRAHAIGMTGKWAIHPSQVEPIQAVFTPSEEHINAARKHKAAYELALANGRGAINVDGVMVDAASIRMNQTLLDQADLLEL